MQIFSNNLYTDTEKKVNFLLEKNNQDEELVLRDAINIWSNGLKELKNFFNQYTLKTKEEEIDFFKNIKPKFTSELIYLNEKFNIERNKPASKTQATHKYYKKKLKKVKSFFKENFEFYKYIRSNYKYLDELYFVRNSNNPTGELDTHYFNTDTHFSTTQDFKVAWIIAYEKLEKDILEILKYTSKTSDSNLPLQRSLIWTGSKVSIIELIYALHSAGVFNHGSCTLKETVQMFSQVFNIELMQFHRIFNEITARKIERTKFLNALAQHLISKMEQAESI